MGRIQYAPTLTAEDGASNKHVFAPIGSFVGRIQYAPTRDNKKRKMNNEKIRYPAKLAGIPDALIFFSHPFLVSRQEKDVGVRGQRPLHLCYMRRTAEIWPFPSSCTRPHRVVCGAYAIRPYPDGRKWGIQQTCIRPFGPFVGRIQYAPTRDNKKRKTNNERARYLAKFPGLGEALIFFSHPFLVSRQEKDGFWKKIDGNHDRNISCRQGRGVLHMPHRYSAGINAATYR